MIHDEVEFVKELPPTGNKGRSGRVSKVPNILEKLKTKPGVWACVETYKKKKVGKSSVYSYVYRHMLRALYEVV